MDKSKKVLLREYNGDGVVGQLAVVSAVALAAGGEEEVEGLLAGIVTRAVLWWCHRLMTTSAASDP